MERRRALNFVLITVLYLYVGKPFSNSILAGLVSSFGIRNEKTLLHLNNFCVVIILLQLLDNRVYSKMELLLTRILSFVGF